MEQEKRVSALRFNGRAQYQLCLKGHLDDSWSDRICGMAIYNRKEQGTAIVELIGSVRDQAELLALVCNLYELHLPIISISLHDRRKDAVHRLDENL